LDIVGHRIPNVFIDRQGDSEEEIARVGNLGRNLAPDEAVMIYPEGTRFSTSKKERIVRRCEARGDTVSAEYARSLRHLLPPRMGGALALLDAANSADVVFCAHKGFESTRRAVDFLNGSLIDATIRVRLWRVPVAEVPEGAKARAAWLLDRWKGLDGWVDRAPDGGMAS
jgi:1-acyl-sn-glycerol-3-phosphate acyltransferase